MKREDNNKHKGNSSTMYHSLPLPFSTPILYLSLAYLSITWMSTSALPTSSSVALVIVQWNGMG
jgi:hypothetical protein